MTTSTQTQLRRGTTTQVNSMTPAVGEVVVDTTLSQLCVGDATTAGGIKIPSAQNVQKQSFVYATVGGTGDAITLTNSPVVAAYTAPLKQVFKAGASNTGAVTVNVDTLGTKNVKKMNNGSLVALVANDIISGGIYEIMYDGTQFQIKGLSEGPYKSGALTYLGTVTASSSATVDLTSLISSTYDDYLITLDQIVSGTSSNSLLLRTSNNNGSSFDSGGADYSYAGTGETIGAAAVTFASNGNTAIFCLKSSDLTGSGQGICGTINLCAVNAAVNARVQGSLTYNGSDYRSSNFFGVRLTNSAINAVRFLMSSGNIDSGTFRLYGISKS